MSTPHYDYVFRLMAGKLPAEKLAEETPVHTDTERLEWIMTHGPVLHYDPRTDRPFVLILKEPPFPVYVGKTIAKIIDRAMDDHAAARPAGEHGIVDVDEDSAPDEPVDYATKIVHGRFHDATPE